MYVSEGAERFISNYSVSECLLGCSSLTTQMCVVLLHWSKQAIYTDMKSENSCSIRRMAVCRVEMDSRKGGGGEVCVSECDCWRRGSCSRANLCNTCACDPTVYYFQHSQTFYLTALSEPISPRSVRNKQFNNFFWAVLDHVRLQ